MLEKKKHKTVIFAPLNWGLGHATRIVPLIKRYITEEWKVIWVAEGIAYHFLEEEFPNLKHYKTNALELKYSKRQSLFSHLFKLVPNFLRNIQRDYDFVKKLCQEETIDLIVSDNRYGFHHPEIKSIILTHQVQLPINTRFKSISSIVQNQVHKWINQFDECWIIDDNHQTYAGKLSKSKGIRISHQYIGLLSRMELKSIEKDIDILIILSGLEPHRTNLEKELIALFENTQLRVILIGGKIDCSEPKNTSVEYYSFTNSTTLNEFINRSKLIICRSGYSSIMDLVKLKQKAIIIPTPGQPEQVYLTQLHAKSPQFISIESVKEIEENNLIEHLIN